MSDRRPQPAPHEPGCLGNHLGDCAVSGYFTAPSAEQASYRIIGSLRHIDEHLEQCTTRPCQTCEEFRELRAILTDATTNPI